MSHLVRYLRASFLIEIIFYYPVTFVHIFYNWEIFWGRVLVWIAGLLQVGAGLYYAADICLQVKTKMQFFKYTKLFIVEN